MTKRIVSCLTLAALLLHACSSIAASPKRGWAGGEADEINASNASWYYRWWHDIPASAAGAIADFVPLIKFYSTPQNLQNKLDIINGFADVDTVLVLNEPERPDQSDVTVADAIGFWPQVQSNLPTHKLVSPGVSDNAAGQAWLTDFMNQVEALNANADPSDDLRVDSVAFHWYGASSPNNPAGAAANFLNRVDWYHTTFNRPVWITEFAMHDWEGDDTDAAMIQANADFLEIVIPELENRSYVEAYSFYQHFSDAQVYVDSPLAPSPIGDQYIGTLQAGETQDFAGTGIGTDVVYLRGASLMNSGAAIVDATRGVDALEGVNTLGGAGDWSIPPRRDAYLRVRSGATLRKEGAFALDVNSEVSVEGTLRVAEGTVRFIESPFSGGGTTQVDAGATLNTTWQGGRGVYVMNGHTLDAEGRVEGPIRLRNGSTLVTRGTTAVFDSNLTVENSVIEVGGQGMENGGLLVAPVTSGLMLDYDAASDTPGDSEWTDGTGSGDDLMFLQTVSPIGVNDSVFRTLTDAYAIGQHGGANGLNQYFEQGGPAISRQDATFEVVFNVTDTNAGNDQVIMEVGGAARGVAMVLNGDVLTFNVDGDASDIEITHQVGTGWRHAIGVIDLTAGDDSISLYVDGQLVGTLPGQTIDDWAGGNIAGIGEGASSVTGVSSGTGNAFHGDIAITRYYQGVTFDGSDAMQNYDSLTSGFVGVPGSLLVEGDLTIEGGSVLKIDLGDGGASDKVDVLGSVVLNNAEAEFSYEGVSTLQGGDSFDVLDAAAFVGDFSMVSLPALDPGLMWNLNQLTVDGTLSVTISGDYNGDGTVDIADYTVWRDSLGVSTAINAGADGNGDGMVDAADYLVWTNNFGATLPASSAAIPEPSSIALSLLGVAFIRHSHRRTGRLL